MRNKLISYPLKDGHHPHFHFTIGKTRVAKEFHDHTHSYSELVITLGGTAAHRINDNVHMIKAGDVFVMQGTVSHGFTDCRDLVLCNIGYYPAMLAPIEHYVRRSPGYQAVFLIGPAQHEHAICTMKLPLPDIRELEPMIDRMIAEYLAKKIGYEAVLTGMFHGFVVELIRRYTPHATDAPESILKLAAMISHMEAHFLEPLRLHELARMAGLSERQLLRVFRANYHTTPIDYMLRLRIMHAARLLRDTDTPITDIAFASGFSDSNYFTRQFKRIIGQTPSAYRTFVIR